MHWKAKYTRADYKEGATRLKRCFAWLPVYISGDMVWLESYEVLQVYNVSQEKVIIDSKEKVFALGAWKNLSKRCK
jgi:hypothetical protein